MHNVILKYPKPQSNISHQGDAMQLTVHGTELLDEAKPMERP